MKMFCYYLHASREGCVNMEGTLARVPDYWDLVSSLHNCNERVIFEPVGFAGNQYHVRVRAIERMPADHGDTKWQVKGTTEKGLPIICEWTCQGRYQTQGIEGTLAVAGG